MTLSWSRYLLRKIALPLLILFLVRPASATIQYRVSLAHPERHEFHVSIRIPVESEDVIVAMPAWNALYEVRDFASRVRPMLVENAFRRMPLAGHFPEALDKQTWLLCRCGSSPEHPQVVTFLYSVEWNEPGPFTSQLNEHHAFVNLAQVLMYVPGRRSEPAEVRFDDLPAGGKLSH